jgi:hypothetical protein
MPQERMFYAPNAELRPLADELAQWLKGRQFETQILPVEGGGVLIQARQEGGWKAMVGMALATNIVFARMGPNIKVEAGQGKWLDRAVVGAVGVFLLWPALIPAAIGAWQQSKLPEEIFSQVAGYLARQPQQAAQPAEAAQVPCPSCGQMVNAAAKFCEHCGQAMPQQAPKVRHCTQCGAELSATAKFCGECGKPAEA